MTDSCRVKALKTEAYTQEEAERAAGMGSYKAPKAFNTELPVMDVEEGSSQPGPSTSNQT